MLTTVPAIPTHSLAPTSPGDIPRPHYFELYPKETSLSKSRIASVLPSLDASRHVTRELGEAIELGAREPGKHRGTASASASGQSRGRKVDEGSNSSLGLGKGIPRMSKRRSTDKIRPLEVPSSLTSTSTPYSTPTVPLGSSTASTPATRLDQHVFSPTSSSPCNYSPICPPKRLSSLQPASAPSAAALSSASSRRQSASIVRSTTLSTTPDPVLLIENPSRLAQCSSRPVAISHTTTSGRSPIPSAAYKTNPAVPIRTDAMDEMVDTMIRKEQHSREILSTPVSSPIQLRRVAVVTPPRSSSLRSTASCSGLNARFSKSSPSAYSSPVTTCASKMSNSPHINNTGPSNPKGTVRSIDSIIQSNLSLEASRVKHHPLPSAFSPPIEPSNKSSRTAHDFLSPPNSRSRVLNRRSLDGRSSSATPLDPALTDRQTPPSPFSHPPPSPTFTPVENQSCSSSPIGPSSPARRVQPTDIIPVSPFPPCTLSRPSSACSEGPSSRGNAASDSSFSSDPNFDHALLLQSTRMNRLLVLRRAPNQGLNVSLSDVGDPHGLPLLVYLGLGGVRYLTALFDELAKSLGIRLICIDRWGLGKTNDVPAEKRGMLEWADVVSESMDLLGIGRFAVMAHSAGVPYALAMARKFPERILGTMHLLAPWVGTDLDGSYRWLRLVPDSIIRTTRAAEWKLMSWSLGKPPTLDSTYISNVASSFATVLPSDSMGPISSDPPSTGSYDDLRDFAVHFASISMASPSHRSAPSSLPLAPYPSDAQGSPHLDKSNSSNKADDYNSRSSSPHPRPESALASSSAQSRSNRTVTSPSKPSVARMDLGTALIRASHAESQGSSADLLSVMRKSDSWGFTYTEVSRPVKVYWGDKDERVSEKGVRWMERSMKDCTLMILPGEGHNLLSSPAVVIQVLESVAEEIQRRSLDETL